MDEIAEQVAMGRRSMQRVISEPVLTHHDTDHERAHRAIGRPSKAEAYRTPALVFIIGPYAQVGPR